MRPFHIEKRAVGPDEPPFVIAEMSGNHRGSLDIALEIIDAAADAGAHAIKLQTYTADTLTLDVDRDEFVIHDAESLWKGRTLHDLYDEAHTPWEWHRPLFERARARGLICFSTPFDESAVDFLEELDAPCYKIASFENVHLPLIRRVAETGKPIIMSTGMATADELDEAVSAARDAGCEDLVLLKCTSTYPADVAESNLRTIPAMRDRYRCQVGLSDHTVGTAAAVAAIALGATVVEKHFTLDRRDGGVDSAFSIEPAELQGLVENTFDAWKALGVVRFGPGERESGSLQFRRSIYIARDVAAGEVFTRENIRVVRPGLGLAPRHYEEILGQKAARDAAMGTPLSWDMILG